MRPTTAPKLRTPRSFHEQHLLLTARQCIRANQGLSQVDRLSDVGFRVFSQHDDDGIIAWLVNQLNMPRSFVEFGTEDYEEANTRLLVTLDPRWRGLLLDGDPDNIQYIISGELYWRRHLTAVTSFVTPDNINDLLATHGFTGEIGILSIDIDGMDYHVWEAVHVCDPLVVIVEYNAVFGLEPVTVPYTPTFDRTKAHYSNLYFGAGLAALALLGQRKGYALIGSNEAGNNAYFVRRDAMGGLPSRTVEEAYVASPIRESIDEHGTPTFLTGPARRAAIAHLPVLHVQSGVIAPLGLGEAQV